MSELRQGTPPPELIIPLSCECGNKDDTGMIAPPCSADCGRYMHLNHSHLFELFSITNRQRCESERGFNHKLLDWSTSDWFTAVMGELGEAANIAKKLNRVRDGIPGNDETPAELKEELGKELADTFIYLDLLAQREGINLSSYVRRVFNAKSDKLGCEIKVP